MRPGCTQPSSAPRVCVIGAGVSGLTAVKALGDWNVPHICFEASDDVGGNWYFRNPNGRSSAYRSLHIDTSKAAIGFKDFAMDERYPDFPHHSQIHGFLREYADRFGLRERIRFNTAVKRAQRRPRGGWEIDGERFDALLVCNGHHWDPSYPSFAGRFEGPSIHSHHYIDPTEPLNLAGARVLVVGIGNSAVDIVSELSRKGVAEKVFISTRSGAWVIPKYVFGRPVDTVFKTNPRLPLGPQRRLAGLLARLVSGRMEDFGLPRPDHRFLEAHPTVSSELLLRLGSGDAIAMPDVARLDPDRVRFADGSVEQIDAIIYATGYKINFPFFDPDLISAPGNVLRLYKRIWKPGIGDLAFIGLGQAIPTIFPFAECQSKLAAQWLAGDWALPTQREMEREITRDEKRHVKHYSSRPRHTMELDYHVYEHDLRTRVTPEGQRRAQAWSVVPSSPAQARTSTRPTVARSDGELRIGLEHDPEADSRQPGPIDRLPAGPPSGALASLRGRLPLQPRDGRADRDLRARAGTRERSVVACDATDRATPDRRPGVPGEGGGPIR